ncbi:hypothetical protein [Peribacillus sp. SCS-155]|uniref:hypothetical protein n=1 Tax=Peribacillus sedimenti TaxID=3115297 RepID=UPI003906B0F8
MLSVRLLEMRDIELLKNICTNQSSENKHGKDEILNLSYMKKYIERWGRKGIEPVLQSGKIHK